MKASRVEMPIIQHEYFLIEEKNFVQLLTFEWFKPEKCSNASAELTEVNRFDKARSSL
jgi:hypothetical protein